MAAVTVLLNPTSGRAGLHGIDTRIATLFATAGSRAEVHVLQRQEDVADAARAAGTGGSIVVAAGGDGTVSQVASGVIDVNGILGILPLGTLNHFAKDLHLPLGLEEAIDTIASGRVGRVDVGQVNDRVFVNNASIGLYPLMVRKREGLQRAKGWSKWLSTLPAAFAVLERLPHHRLRLDWGKGERAIVTPLLFVGNNVYSLDRGEVGKRGTLTDGKLSVYAVARRRRVAMIWFAMRALVGRAERSLDFETLGECETLTVRSSSGSIEIALDGELKRMDSPLEFRIRPGALTVMKPSDAPQG